MAHLLSVALFAAYTSAQLTTAMWEFEAPDGLNYTRFGSVIGASGDRTTLQLNIKNYTNTRITTGTPETRAPVTLGGLTYIEYTESGTPAGASTAVTFVVICSRANERITDATCMQSLVGAESKLSEECGYYSRSEIKTTTVTDIRPARSDRPETTRIETWTNDYRSNIPEYCSNSTLLSEVAKSPDTFPGEAMATYALVITAGQEKLTASAGTTPTGSGASPTGANSGATPTPTASGSGSAGAAASIHVPALAGMGAVAAFFL